MPKRFLPLLGTLAIVGCAGPSLEGSWKVTPGEPPPVPVDITMTFKKPDVVQASISATVDLPAGAKFDLKSEAQGIWKLDGDTLRVSVDSAKTTAADGKELPSMVQEMADGQVKASINSNGTGKLKWDGADRFTVTLQEGKTATFERKKG